MDQTNFFLYRKNWFLGDISKTRANLKKYDFRVQEVKVHKKSWVLAGETLKVNNL